MVPVPAVPESVRDVPAYWDDACRHLVKRDRVMKKLIPKFGDARLQSNGDAFTTLARSIVGQQVSTKSAQGVWRKLVAAVDGPGVALLEPAAEAEQGRRPLGAQGGVPERPGPPFQRRGRARRPVAWHGRRGDHRGTG